MVMDQVGIKVAINVFVKGDSIEAVPKPHMLRYGVAIHRHTVRPEPQ